MNKNEKKDNKIITIEEAEADGKITVDEFNHLDKRTSAYKHLLENYKKRNKLVEIVVACVIVLIVFFVACNQTFLKTSYTKKIGNSTIELSLPRFTYYVSSDNEKIIFKTLRKSENTRKFFDDFLAEGADNGKFDVYYCDDEETPYYYSSQGKYFISDIKVEKTFAIKTITVSYSTVELDLFCETIKNDK